MPVWSARARLRRGMLGTLGLLAIQCVHPDARARVDLSLEPPDPPEVALVLEHPADGLVLGRGSCGLLVTGRAGPPDLDLVLVLDTSVSTARPSGSDVDGDGVTGLPVPGRVGPVVEDISTDPEDSILSAEVQAGLALLARLDLRRTRVALATFSGGAVSLDRPQETVPDALTRVPLGNDRPLLESALYDVLRVTPAGGTHMAAGIDRATIELLGLRDARSEADPRRARAAVLITDGVPTVPYGPDRAADNVRATLAAAERARKARVRVTTVAVGPDALEGPVAAVEIARRTGGRFLAVRDPADLPAAMGEVDLLRGLRVELRNATSGEPARAFRMSPDGSFGGFVPLVEGPNLITARARADAGGEALRSLGVALDPSAPAPPVPRGYDFLGDDAFGACLAQSRQVDLEAEDLQREQLRRQLRLELERERARALERAAEQRRELELEPDPGPQPEPHPDAHPR